MKTALELSFDVLAKTPNLAAERVLSLAFSDHADLRERAIGTLLRRRSLAVADQILASWHQLTDDELRAVQDQPAAMQPAIERTLLGPTDSPSWLPALDALRMLGLASLLPLIIDRIETCGERRLRNRMLATVLELGAALGDAARRGREQPSVREPVVRRLAESVRRFNFHRCEELCEAFLAASSWGDRDLRILLQEDLDASRLLTKPLNESNLPGVVQLVAGYCRRRNIPEVVRRAIESRTDKHFLDSLMKYAGIQPARMAVKNLQGMNPLAALRPWQTLVARVPTQYHEGLLYAHTANSDDAIAQLTIALDVIVRDSHQTDLAAVSALSNSETLDDADLFKAAIEITNTDMVAVSRNPVAQVLWRMLQLLDHPDPAIVQALRAVLRPLQVDRLLKNIDAVPATNFKQLGGLVRRIDPDLVAVVGDELRSTVMDRRLRAIKVARACAIVKDVESLIIHAAVHDHREARMFAIATLVEADSEASLDALHSIAAGPNGALRDLALQTIEQRTNPTIAIQLHHWEPSH